MMIDGIELELKSIYQSQDEHREDFKTSIVCTGPLLPIEHLFMQMTCTEIPAIDGMYVYVASIDPAGDNLYRYEFVSKKPCKPIELLSSGGVADAK